MIWIIATVVLGWLLCSAWALRMDEKENNSVQDDWWVFYSLGPIGLIIGWFFVWPGRIKDICKCIYDAWKDMRKHIKDL